MSSNIGNPNDFTACPGDHSLFSTGSDLESDNLSRQEFAQSLPLPSDMGLRFLTAPVSDDPNFGPESASISQQSGYSNNTSLPTLSSSTIPVTSYSHGFQPGPSGSITYHHSNPPFFQANPHSYCIPDTKLDLRYNSSDFRPITGYPTHPEIKPFTGEYLQNHIMAPPSRSPNIAYLNAPTRELYSSVTPQLRRDSGFLPRSPSVSINMRAAPTSPSSSSGFASPANMETAAAGPPLNMTEVLVLLQTSDGTPVRAELLGKVDKGFFMADNDWTCYRRNYFQLSCSFTLHPMVTSPLLLQVMHNGNLHQVHGFSVSIGAVVDGRDGRAIELVQHTPKRDKGPQVKPDRNQLSPRPHVIQSYSQGGSENGTDAKTVYEHPYNMPTAGHPPMECTYERIQFKCATANNGRRRAAQQYYHLVVELSVDIGAHLGEDARWVQIARRISAPVVVRGRSPGHYHAERRHSNASAGGSAGPNNGSGSYETNNGIQRSSESQVAISGTPSMVPSSGYATSYESRTHRYTRSDIEVPMEPIMSADEIRAIDETEGYLYYPSPIFEGTNAASAPHTRSHLSAHPQREPHGTTYSHHGAGPRIKQEPGYPGYNLPSLTAGTPSDSLGRHFGRFEGLPSSKGYYPRVFTNTEYHGL